MPESHNPPSSARIFRSQVLLGAAALVAVTAIAYLPVFGNGFIWDDDYVVTGSSLIKSASGLYRTWFTANQADYWPMTSSVLWIEWRLWSMHAAGYHAVNVALHIGEALLLWAILRRLRIPGALLAALIFAVHPVNVETVAWISEVKNLTAMLFYLATVWCFLNTGIASPSPKCRSGWYALGLFSFTLGMLSKGSIATLPLVLLGLIAWNRRLVRKDIVRLAPFFIVSAVLVLVDVWFQKHGTAEIFRHAGFLERLLGAGAVVWFYLGKALWPVNLMFVYPEWHIRAGDPRWWLPLLAAAGVTAALWWRRRGVGRPFLFAWGFFCISLVPVMGFTDVYFMKYSLVADHYEHLAMIGVVGLVAAGWGRWEGKFTFPFPQIAAAAVVVMLACLTWRECGMYRDARTLFLATVQRNPACWMAYDYLAETPPSRGQPEEIDYLEKAVEIKPDYADAQLNLGVALAKSGRLQEAVSHYEMALQSKPGFAEAHSSLGVAFYALGRTGEATAQFEEAVRLEPDSAENENNLGNVLFNVPGRLPEATALFERAVRHDPGSAVMHANLGEAYLRGNRLAEAVSQFEEAVRLNPDDARARAGLDRLRALQQSP